MAKFGIALGAGPRGRGFESRYSDQKEERVLMHPLFFLVCTGIRKADTSALTGVKIESWRAIFRPWENPFLSERIPSGCGQKEIYFMSAL